MSTSSTSTDTNITMYGISNCDTIKKARQYLAQQQVAYHFHDYKKAGVPSTVLAQAIEQCGWEKVTNRQGRTWRQLSAASQAQIHDEASAQAFLLSQPSAIKRPLMQWANGRITLGFDADQWQSCFLDN